jgi:parallel beta-helix repeat protein
MTIPARRRIATVGFWFLWQLSQWTVFGYTNPGGGLYQSDGSDSDTQAACNAASDGQTVQIPNGTYTWTNGVDISGKAITLEGQSVGGVTIKNSSTGVFAIIGADEATTGNVVIANLRMVDSGSKPPASSGLNFHIGVNHTSGGQPVLLHDCYFSGNGSTMVYTVSWATNGGVIWNCTFDSLFTFATGIEFEWINGANTWTTLSTMGTADTSGANNTYVEDCTFLNGWIAGMDFADNARTVIRNNTFRDTSIYCHGQDSSPYGPRHYEIYNNTFIYDATPSPYPLNLQDWMTLRGATGVIWGNVFPQIPARSSVLMLIYGLFMSPCYTLYPVPRQIGQTWVGNGGYSYPQNPSDGSGYGTDPLYIWNNTGSGAVAVSANQIPDNCGNNELISNFIVLGRDYILNSKPGYTPYPYPHPLRASVSPSPTPTPSPSPTPTPTPTPAPTPTPSPSPTPTPSPIPTPTPTPSPTVTPTPTATPTPSPTPPRKRHRHFPNWNDYFEDR